jgi:HlyD family secretion protein
LEGRDENYSPFRPGMTATVDVITKKREKIVGVPISAIVIKTDTSSTRKKKVKDAVTSYDQEQFECVFIKEGDKAKLRVVKTGIQDNSNIEILEGLNGDEEIITGPYNTVSKTLKNGDKVEIKPENTEDKEEDF